LTKKKTGRFLLKKTNLALFDFDGTITTKDTLVGFIQYAAGKKAYYLGLLKLSPMLTAYTLKLIPNYEAKERMIAHFFQGWDSIEFQSLANRYSLEEIDKITRPQAIQQIRWHQEQKDKVVIVSASMECWLKAWCEQYNIDLLSTRLEVRDQKITGKFATKNCHGVEKVQRIKERYNLKEYNKIYGYGDSSGDKALLALADESFYKPFRG